MIHKISWGIALILIGLIVIPVSFPLLTVLAGIALVIAGISYLAEI